MAVVWKTRKKPRWEIKDEKGNVIAILFASGRRGCPGEKISCERPTKLLKKRS